MSLQNPYMPSVYSRIPRVSIYFVGIVASVFCLLICIGKVHGEDDHLTRLMGPPSGSDFVLKYKDSYMFIENKLNFKTRSLPFIGGSQEAEQGDENLASVLYYELLEEIDGMEKIEPSDYRKLYNMTFYRVVSNSFSNVASTEPSYLRDSGRILRICNDFGYKENMALNLRANLWTVAGLVLLSVVGIGGIW